MKNIWTVLRFIIDHLQTAVDNFIPLLGEEHQKRLRESVMPVMPGSSVILGISLLERLVTDLISQTPHSGAAEDPTIPTVGNLRRWQSHLNLDPKWYGWSELGNFIRLRHCFAHEFGRLTGKQKAEVENFLTKLQNGSILDKKGEKVPAYYEIVGREIVLKPESLNYFRRLCKGFIELLQHSGFSPEN
jgi:hypothetical protein